MVFSATKRAPTGWPGQLRDDGVDAAAIHGDLRQSDREKALADFSEGKLPVLVATDVAARGIHIDDVDVVIHYDPPEDHKAYLHRSGRTARAGESGVVVTLVLWNQELEVRRLKRRLKWRSPSWRSSPTIPAWPTSAPSPATSPPTPRSEPTERASRPQGPVEMMQVPERVLGDRARGRGALHAPDPVR